MNSLQRLHEVRRRGLPAAVWAQSRARAGHRWNAPVPRPAASRGLRGFPWWLLRLQPPVRTRGPTAAIRVPHRSAVDRSVGGSAL